MFVRAGPVNPSETYTFSQLTCGSPGLNTSYAVILQRWIISQAASCGRRTRTTRFWTRKPVGRAPSLRPLHNMFIIIIIEKRSLVVWSQESPTETQTSAYLSMSAHWWGRSAAGWMSLNILHRNTWTNASFASFLARTLLISYFHRLLFLLDEVDIITRSCHFSTRRLTRFKSLVIALKSA